MKHSSVSLILLTLGVVSGCAQTTPLVNNESLPVEETSKAADLFKREQKVIHKDVIKHNRKAKMSRDEQIKLAVDAAVDDRVTPLLNQQPVRNVVYFHYSSPVVGGKWDELLRSHADYMATDLSIRLLVAGFTDYKGTVQYNLKLGQQRADNVCAQLRTFGVRKEQLTCVSYGESHPADPGTDEQARSRNRRVELLY